MIPKKVYISIAVWDEGRKYDFLEVRERPYQTTDTQCHWREYTDLSQVWHDASEEPSKAYPIMIEIDDDIDPTYDVITVDGKDEKFWKFLASDRDITRWAYITDLLPKGGEK